MLEQFANQVSSTLNGALDASTSSVIVASATGFPTSGQFSILVENELMTVTSVSAETFTVTRGAESTTATTHAHGITVKHVLSKRSMDAGRVLVGHVKKTAAQSINDAVAGGTVVTFPTSVTADDATFTGGGTDRLVAPLAGIYLITAHVHWAVSVAGKFICWYEVNGDTGQQIGASEDFGDVSHNIVFAQRLSANDYVQVRVYQDSGGAVDVNSGHFSLTFLGS
jgi:hypothetical protein